jgi:hypothetical protein
MLQYFENKKSLDEYKRLIKKNKDYYATLSPEEIQAITYYKSNGYMDINSVLNGKIDFDSIDNLDNIIKNIELLTKVILNAPVTKSEITLYRGMNNFLKRSYFENEKVFYKAESFISMSIIDDVATEFLGTICCIYKVTIPKGTPVLPILTSDVLDYEVELILPPHTVFHVDKNPTTIMVDKLIFNTTKDISLNELDKYNYSDIKKVIKGSTVKRIKVPMTTYKLKVISVPKIDNINEIINIDKDFLDVMIKLKNLNKLKNLVSQVQQQKITQFLPFPKVQNKGKNTNTRKSIRK